MYAVINRQADQDRHKRDGQNIQVADRERGEGQRVAQPYDEAQRRLHWPARLLVTVNENQRANEQRSDAGDGCVLLRLRHFVVLQHRLTRQTHVKPRHLGFSFLDQLTQLLNGCAIELLGGGLGGDQKDVALGKSDVHVLEGLFARIEQRHHAWGRRGASAAEAGVGFADNPFQSRQRFDHRFIFRVGLARRGAELRIDGAEK